MDSNYIAYGCLAIYGAMMSVATLGTVVVVSKFWHKDESTFTKTQLDLLPGVTILRPLKGIDNNLQENLESSFLQKYTKYEIIFSVADDDDPAINIVKSLQLKYPFIDARLVIGACNIGVNPKVNNLVTGYNEAKHGIVWILDSNVHTNEYCLARSITKLTSDPKIGLIHHLPCAVKPESFGAMLEMCFLNTSHAKLYSAINFSRASSCIVGKSNLFYKSNIEKVGGFKNFGQYMSEDNIIGQAIWDQGLKHEMTSDFAYQSLGTLSVIAYFKRRSRWTRIRKYAVPIPTLVEPATESLLCGLFGAFAFSELFGFNWGWVYFFHMMYWMATDFAIAYTLYPWPLSKLYYYVCGNSILCFCIVIFVIAWIVREISAIHVYLYAVAGSTVEWRGTTYKLNGDGTVIPAANYPQGIFTFTEFLNPLAWFTFMSNVFSSRSKSMYRSTMKKEKKKE